MTFRSFPPLSLRLCFDVLDDRRAASRDVDSHDPLGGAPFGEFIPHDFIAVRHEVPLSTRPELSFAQKPVSEG